MVRITTSLQITKYRIRCPFSHIFNHAWARILELISGKEMVSFRFEFSVTFSSAVQEFAKLNLSPEATRASDTRMPWRQASKSCDALDLEREDKTS